MAAPRHPSRAPRRSLFVGLSAAVLALSCSRREAIPPPRADLFVRRADAATPWLAIAPGESLEQVRAIDAHELDALGREFQEFSTSEARDIVMRLLDGAMKRPRSPLEPEGTLSKVFVLLRFYFRVPGRERAQKFRAFGGWRGVPEIGGEVDALWPLTQDADGSVHLRGAYQGYMGEPYDALGEFDHLNSRYGPRCPRDQ